MTEKMTAQEKENVEMDEYREGQVVTLTSQINEGVNQRYLVLYPPTEVPLTSAEGWDTITLTASEAASLNSGRNVQRYFGEKY